jgi:hypothetical protein
MLEQIINAINNSTFTNPFQVTVFVFLNGGWVFVLGAFLVGGWWAYLQIIRARFEHKQKHILLAIDVPKENEQTPKAMEQAFAQLYGIQKKPNLVEKYIDGYVQPAFSLEIISIDGYIQFLIRAPEKFRDLVESSFYAQYPNAEISEVEDYVESVPWKFPNDEYQMWGTEFKLTKPSPYPIRTYPSFEHTLTQTFLDPMSAMLEALGHLRVGEQIWLQIIIAPDNHGHWHEQGLHIIKKLIGAKVHSGGSILDGPSKVAVGVYETLTASLFAPGTSESSHSDKEMPSLLQHMPPNERTIVEAVGTKIAKLGWETKFRYAYIAKKEIYDSSRNASVFGALQQFNSLDLNSFKSNSKVKTGIDYFFVERRTNARRRRLMWRYRHRSEEGTPPFILNTEELASIYHFPVITVKAPLVKKSEAKRGEPPASLPLLADEQPENIPVNLPTT